MDEDYQRLGIERDGPVLTVRLSNPAARNAVDGRMHEELPRLLRAIAADEATRVVVLTGDPAGRAFCAGGDLNWLREFNDDPVKLARVIHEGLDVVKALTELPQPVIAMVNGHAMGLGATLALMCDVSFMDRDARIADPHVSVGVVAGDGGAVIWPLLIGPNRAKEFLMTGDALTGAEAERIGLVNHALAAGELADAAYALARRLAAGPQLAIRWTKRAVNLFVGQVIEQVLTGSLALEGITFMSADHREAVRAFFAKEPPRFG